MRTTLIWHREITNVHHRDWIRFLLGDVVQDEIVDLHGDVCHPYSVVLEDNRSQTPTSFFSMAAACRPIGLFHISDQYFGYDYNKYRHFDFVIKTHWSSVFEVDRVMVVPIGYQSDLPFPKDVAPTSQRPLLWSFAGGVKSSRYDMVRVLQSVEPNVIHATSGVPSPEPPLAKQQYADLLAGSMFSPCPMGNIIMESWRLYESLEAGCIPIVERRPLLSYYERLLKNPPFIFVWSWREAKNEMLRLAADPAQLNRLQRGVYDWWQQFKIDLRKQVAQLVAESFSGGTSSPAHGIRVKMFARLPGWHYAELLRHQSPPALLRRVGRNLLGGRMRVPF